ncbi:MAG: peroxidase family protein [Polyangiales bacterium]
MPPTPAKPWVLALAVIMYVVLSGMSCETRSSREIALAAMDPNGALDPNLASPPPPPPPPSEYRSINGTGNHPTYSNLGAANTVLRRLVPVDYGDRISSMGAHNRPSARVISNAVCADTQGAINPLGASDFLWQWGQFVDHDIDLTETNPPFEPEIVVVPRGDPFFDPFSTGLGQVDFFRSRFHPATGISTSYPRQQMNAITHFLDASNVYGSSAQRAAALRTNDGTGMLRVSAGNLLPFNTTGLENAGGTGSNLFLAGDIRANEQVALTAMHTLFVREHNRLAQEIAALDPSLSGEEIYQQARRMVGALIQAITYNEFLPALLGPNALSPYNGYSDVTSPAITNLFSTAIYRFGHSALSPTILRLTATGVPIPQGNLPLMNAFFSPQRIINEGGIEPILRGLASQRCARIDTEVVDDVRNFLFGPPGAGGLDLAALNIQRGRDHGLPSYAVARLARGLGRIDSFNQVTSDPALRARLASVYATVDDIDVWVGALAEDPVNGGHVGTLANEVIRRQFEWLRDGDAFWYELVLTPAELAEVESTTLADVIRRNTTIDTEIGDDVFHVN